MKLFERFRKSEPAYEPKEIAAPVDGEIIDLASVKDEVFASGSMGMGVGILPESEQVLSPVDGVVSVVFPTGHAYGITGDNGVEILIHIGIDTVELNKEGFVVNVKQGQRISRGKKLGSFDQHLLEERGYDTTIMLVITNKAEVAFHYGKCKANTGIGMMK